MNLMIIESAGKLKKIKEILGKNFFVAATLGHFRELDNAGVDNIGFNENYEPIFRFSEKGTAAWSNIKDMLKKFTFEKIYIASDPDREGEAIAWHIYNNLSTNDKKKSVRIRFNEITEEAIKNAISNPDKINQNLVEAQFCRQIYDKDFGFKISRFIKHHTQEARSLGRVQGVVVKLLSDRENEIKNWIPVYKQKLKVSVLDKNKKEVALSLVDEKLKPISFEDGEEIKIKNNNELLLKEIQYEDNVFDAPPLPYKTSTLLQDIISKFKLSSKQAQKSLQVLYEKGLITYPRTDSFTISGEFMREAFIYIKEVYGFEFPNVDMKQHKNKDNSQEGHECLRITHFEDIDLYKMRSDIDDITKNIYKLIYQRTLAMLMKSTSSNLVIYKFIDEENNLFICKSKIVIFEGWKIVYGGDIKSEDVERYAFDINNKYPISSFSIERYIFNPSPKLFKESDVIKELEKKSIGRPSTFSMYSGVVLDRGYAILNSKKELELTNLGKQVEQYIDNPNFKIAEFINYEFTANFEKELDDIANNKIDYKTILDKYHKLINDRYLITLKGK